MDKRRRGWVWIVAALVMVLVVYPLSVGPAIRLATAYPDQLAGIYGVVYGPLILLTTVCEPAGRALDWYGRLWMP